MTQTPLEKIAPPVSCQNTLPTMYDLPSEDPEELGLPDEFHLLQPWFLINTFYPANYSPSQIFVGIDINLYYDVNHTGWYKRPDWFAVVGTSNLYQQRDLRLSYVIWQEKISPLIVVELLSPGTEKEDLGETTRESEEPPTKWQVYEQILRIPYYVIYDRYSDRLIAYKLTGNRYREITLDEPRIWIEEIQLGLGLWWGEFQHITRQWLRWYDAQGNWILTEAQRERQAKERERQAKEKERERADKLAQKLREMGINPDEI